MVHEELNPKFP